MSVGLHGLAETAPRLRRRSAYQKEVARDDPCLGARDRPEKRHKVRFHVITRTRLGPRLANPVLPSFRELRRYRRADARGRRVLAARPAQINFINH
jgi:hypothetical protein